MPKMVRNLPAVFFGATSRKKHVSLYKAVMKGSNSGKHSLSTLVGIGSREHDFDFDDAMNLWTSSTESS